LPCPTGLRRQEGFEPTVNAVAARMKALGKEDPCRSNQALSQQAEQELAAFRASLPDWQVGLYSF
jgi:hypothetical protein